MRALLLAIAATASLAAQAGTPSAPSARFDVVSVKRNNSGDQNASVRPRAGGGLTVMNNTLLSLVRNAYGLQNFQIVGGPEWLDRERFDIIATGSGAEVPFPVMLDRLRALLSDRFGLVVHREMRDTAVYALVLARKDGQLGPQLRQSTIDCRPSVVVPGGTPPKGIIPPGQPAGEQPVCGGRTRRGLLMVGGAGLEDVARQLAASAGRSIVDKTGLTGTFDLTLTWDPDPAGAAVDPASPNQGLSHFTAVQEQLGLRLEPQRAPVEVLVIDRAEPPTEN